MSEELRPCPFCPDGGDLQLVTFTGGADDVVHCHTCDTILKHKIWQTRPIEDELLDRISELEAENDQLTAHSDIERQDDKSPNDTQTSTIVCGKENEMRVFKDGNAWCFVLPDFQDLQVSSSVWMKEGVLDKIYKELRSVRNE